MHEFEYRRVQSVDEAIALMQEDEDAKLLAGGMTLLPTMKQRFAQPSLLLDLAAVAELHGIECNQSTINIGAGCTHASVAHSIDINNTLPALAKLAGSIGDPQVRNRGTLGGSVANADPSADYPAAVVGLRATVCTDKREIDADDFFIDLFETALEEDELITRVRFNIPEKASYTSFRNPASRYAIAGVFIAKFDNDFRVAVTGAAGSVFRWNECELALANGASVPEIEKLELPDSQYNEDMHASAEYRAHLVRVLTCKALAEL